MESLQPASVDEALGILNRQLSENAPVQISGNGSRFPSGNFPSLTAKKLNRLLFFHPEDMVVGVEAGMKVSELQAIVAEKNMVLQVEPASPETTVGSALACADAGAAKLFGGGIRDAVIGVEYINGFGKHVKGGGKVVKNVAGYDLPKMMTGSYGALGFITGVNFKVMPAASHRRYAFLRGPLDEMIYVISELNRRFIPLHDLRMIYDGNAFTLAAGFAGNNARTERIENDINALGGHAFVFCDVSDAAQVAAFLPSNSTVSAAALSEAWGNEAGLCLQVFTKPSEAVSAELWKKIMAVNARVLVHPFSGDMYLFGQATDDSAAKTQISDWLAFFSDSISYFILHRPHGAGRYSDFSRLPDQLVAATLLKKSLDPSNIFFSPFFAQL